MNAIFAQGFARAEPTPAPQKADVTDFVDPTIVQVQSMAFENLEASENLYIPCP